MATPFDLEFRGRDGADITTPRPSGALGASGLDGRPGIEKGWLIKTCSTPATDGRAGLAGLPPEQAAAGGPGDDVPAVTLRCARVAGPPLDLLFQAGRGGNGGHGGVGGDGGAGGDAGVQPKSCAAKHSATTGGTGGGAGTGGQGGDAGRGGSVGLITITWDQSVAQPYGSARVVAGDAGTVGTGGDPGQPGVGGRNGDRTTRAPDGPKATQGGYGRTRPSGTGSKIKSSTATAPADQLVLVVEPTA